MAGINKTFLNNTIKQVENHNLREQVAGAWQVHEDQKRRNLTGRGSSSSSSSISSSHLQQLDHERSREEWALKKMQAVEKQQQEVEKLQLERNRAIAASLLGPAEESGECDDEEKDEDDDSSNTTYSSRDSYTKIAAVGREGRKFERNREKNASRSSSSSKNKNMSSTKSRSKSKSSGQSCSDSSDTDSSSCYAKQKLNKRENDKYRDHIPLLSRSCSEGGCDREKDKPCTGRDTDEALEKNASHNDNSSASGSSNGVQEKEKKGKNSKKSTKSKNKVYRAHRDSKLERHGCHKSSSSSSSSSRSRSRSSSESQYKKEKEKRS